MTETLQQPCRLSSGVVTMLLPKQLSDKVEENVLYASFCIRCWAFIGFFFKLISSHSGLSTGRRIKCVTHNSNFFSSFRIKMTWHHLKKLKFPTLVLIEQIIKLSTLQRLAQFRRSGSAIWNHSFSFRAICQRQVDLSVATTEHVPERWSVPLEVRTTQNQQQKLWILLLC